MAIDLNAGLGEGGMDDAAIMPFITSANIACAMHAGDPETMDKTVALALSHGIQIGAHPGYADRHNFGRIPVSMSLAGVEDLVLYQIAALDGFVQSHGGVLSHVKPHGALYNQAAEEEPLARAVARGVARAGRDLALIGLATTDVMRRTAEAEGLRFAAEAFADRRYERDGTLQSRRVAGSVITDPAAAADQAVRIARDGVVVAVDGTEVRLRADTLCLHGDNPEAVANARAVRQALERAGVEVCSFARAE